MKLEALCIVAILASVLVNVAQAAHPAEHRALPVAHHHTASMPRTTASWTVQSNSYRSVGR